MEIRKLEELSGDPAINWGLNGYITDKIFVVSAIEIKGSFEFSLREKKQPYTKIWETNPDDIDELNTTIRQGHSFGAYENDELVAWAICDSGNGTTAYLLIIF